MKLLRQMAKKTSQKQIGEMAGIEQSYISQIINRKKSPRIRKAIAIEKCLGYPNDILTLEKMGFGDVVSYIKHERNSKTPTNNH